MKNKFFIPLAIIILLIVAAGGYLYATAMMDSLTDYRSPLANDPPAPGESLGEPLTRRVVFILVDALREDTSLNSQVMPFLDTLRQQGAWATMHSIPPTYSAPSWTTLLTGAWPDINDGQSINPPDNDSVRAFTQDSIFDGAQRAGLQTAVSGYSWFEGMLANAGVDAGFYTAGEDDAADHEVIAAALPWLQGSDHQLILIHLDQVDWAGHHEGGPQDPRWDAAAGRVDVMLKEIVSQLDLSQDTLIVLSDHGQIDRGGHGGQDPVTMLEPFIMVGAGVTPGYYEDVQMVDVAPTIAALLGLQLPGSNQGRVLDEMLVVTPEQSTSMKEVTAAQQANLLAAYQQVIGVPSQPGQSIAEARQVRLDAERTPRGIIALLLVLVPAVILFSQRTTRTAQLLGGSVLNILLFHLIYGIIVGKTYSLSSVYSADDLIFSTAQYAGTALLITWLFTLLVMRAFSKKTPSAARTSFALLLTTLSLLSVPILWSFFRNGLLVSWTLPEFNSMFFGFLSVLQGLFVSVIGLLLAGVAAIIDGLRRKRV
ncbi:alkaline phosphatase family protein [Chloroflexota bacterium]